MDSGQELKSEGYASSDTGSLIGSSDSEELSLSQSSQRRYIGRVKSCGNEYGFIECAETYEQYNRDVHFRTNEVPEDLRNPSQCLSFILGVNEKGRPQAKDVKGFGAVVQKETNADEQQVAVEQPNPEKEQPNTEISPASSTTSARGLTLTRLTQPKGEPWANIDVEGLEMLNGSGAAPRAAAHQASSPVPSPEFELEPDAGLGFAAPAVASDCLLDAAEDEEEAGAVSETYSNSEASGSRDAFEEEPSGPSGAAFYGAAGSSLSAQAAPFVPRSSSDNLARSEDTSQFSAEASECRSIPMMPMREHTSQLSADAPEFEPGSGALSTMATDEHTTQLGAGALDFWPGQGNPLASMATGDGASQLSAHAPEFQPGNSVPHLSPDAPEFQPGSCWTEESAENAAFLGDDGTVLPPPGYEGTNDRKMTQLFANLATKMAETRGMISSIDPTQSSQDAWEGYNPEHRDDAEYETNRSYSWNSWWKGRDSYRNKNKWSNNDHEDDDGKWWADKNYDNRNNGKWARDGDEDGDRKWWAGKDYEHRKNDEWAHNSDEDDSGKWWAGNDYDYRSKHQEQGKGATGASKKARKKRNRKKKRSKSRAPEEGQDEIEEWSSDEEEQVDNEWQRRPPPYQPAEQPRHRDKPHTRDWAATQGSRHERFRQEELTEDEESDSDQSVERPPLRESRHPYNREVSQRSKRASSRDEELTEESDSDESLEQRPPVRQKPPPRAREARQRRTPGSAQAEEDTAQGRSSMEDHGDGPVDSSRVEPLPGHAGIAASVRTQRYQHHSKDQSMGSSGGSADAVEKPEKTESEAAQPAPAAPPRPRPKAAMVDVARFQRMALGHLNRASRAAKREVHTNSNDVASDTQRDN